MTTYAPLTDCDHCDGTGLDATAVWFGPQAQPPDTWAGTTPEPVACPHCKGHGYRGRNGAYRSVSAFKGALTRGTATVCGQGRDQYSSGCQGTGTGRYWPVVQDCYPCRGTGRMLAELPPGAAVPDSVDLYTTAPAEAFGRWLETIPIVAVRQERGQTWGEHNLGLSPVGDAFYVSTDYGRMAALSDTEAVAKLRSTDQPTRPQLLKLVRRSDRVIADALALVITRNGYTPIATYGGATQRSAVALPPTHTPELLNREAR